MSVVYIQKKNPNNCHFRFRLIGLVTIFSACLVLVNLAMALSQPDTTIIAGPNGNISYNDVTFWWTGKTTISDDSERLPSIKGFYYSLDGEPWNWTQDRYITYYNLSNGEHRFYVKSADSNDQQDISPAFRIFTIDNKPISEPDEEKIIFSAPLVEYQGDLNNKSISAKLRQEFSFKGIYLSINAVVSIITKDIEWHITDANKTYYIKKEDENIGAYGPVNDSEAIAMLIPVNKSIICESFNAKDGVDEDWFRIKIERDAQTLLMPRQLGIMFKRLDKSITSVIKLYRFPDTSSGKEIASIEAKDKGYFATGVTPGEYLIHVKPTTESVASTYNLTITTDTLTSTIAWDTEANNNLNNATETSPVFLSKFYPWIDIVGNKWGTADNKDWYRVHIDTTERKRMSINLTRPKSGLVTARLYSFSPMNLLGEFTVNAESGSQWKLELGTGLADYLVEIDLSQYESAVNNVWETPYFVSFQLSDFPKNEVWEVEPNNSIDFADKLPVGTRVRAMRNQTNDSDWFRLDIPNDGILSVALTRIVKTGSINVHLLDLAGQPLANAELANGQQKESLNINIKSGGYFINTDFSGFNGDYWLTAMLIKSIKHDVPDNKILTLGNQINVNMAWEKGNSATFDILYDDSSRKINADPIQMIDNDGIYSGSYVIKEKDNSTDAVIVVHITDRYGNTSDIPILGKGIIIDTKPPVITQVKHNADTPLSVAKELIVTIKGEPENKAIFDIISDDGNIKGLVAYDDGKHDDGSADDGVYVGIYIIKADDYLTDATITGYLTDEAGNIASLPAVIKIDIVGDRPVIFSAEHDGRIILGKDDVLTVDMVGDPGGIASFSIDGLVNNIPMFDDGKHNDGAQGDGKYSGSYIIKENDGAISALLKVQLTDRKGKTSTKTALIKVNIDAISPLPIIGLQAFDRPNDQGNFISLKWQKATEIDFAHYNIYLSKDIPITISKDRPIDIEPRKSDIFDINQTSVDIKVESNLVDYYFAITAVDIMGNESLLDKNGGSISGPVQAKDNLLPTPVKIVSAVDRANDFGGVIILNWTDVNKDEDFAKYNIYQDAKPIINTKILEPIDTITDRQLRIVNIYVDSFDTDYYFAVTAVDLSDNESTLDENGSSVSGPIKAENNIGEQPLTPFVFLSSPISTIHHNHVVFRWSRFIIDKDKQPIAINGYYIKLDDGNWQWTTETMVVYYNLSSGKHRFSVRLPESLSGFTLQREFEINPVLTSEQEPNDSPETASQLRAGIITRGESTNDEDWFRIHIPQSSSACVMNLLLSYANIPSSLRMTVYSSQPFVKIAESENNGINPLNIALGVNPEADYLVKIESQTPYRLISTIDKLPKGYIWEIEENNLSDKANYIEVGDYPQEIIGNADPSDSDWYRIHISESFNKPLNLLIQNAIEQKITIKIYSSPNEINQIGEISDINRIFMGVVKPGFDYYVNVLSDQAIPYRFSISVSDIPIDDGKIREIESNDLAIQANPLDIGIRKFGTSWDGNNDIDFFGLNLAKDGILNVQFSRPNGIGSSIIEVLNSASQPIGTFIANFASGQKGNISLNLKAGAYFVKITPQNESPSAEYSLVAMYIETVKVSYINPDGKEIPKDTQLKAGDSIVLELIWNVENDKALFSIGGDNSIKIEMSQVSNGKYKGIYTIIQGDKITNAPITLYIEDKSSNKAEILLDMINIGIVDSEPPIIVEVLHDGNKPLSEGKILTVRMIGEPRCKAKFDISGFKSNIDMFNMFSKEAIPSLVILNWNWAIVQTFGDKVGIRISGEVKNISSLTHDLAKIEYNLYDENDKIIKSGSSYTTPSRIAPNVVSSFNIFADYTGKEKSIKIKLIYDSEEKVAGETKDDYGVYTGIYEVKENDNVQGAEIACYLTDIAGNQSKLSALMRVSIDNIPPVINSLSYNADAIFVEGDTITVTLNGETNCEATFDIGNFRKGIKMTSEGGQSGLYTGIYRIRSGDEVSGALITAYLKDLAGNTASYIGTKSVTISTSSPNITSVTFNKKDRPFVGDEVIAVTAKTKSNVTVTFDIEGLFSNIPMFDDGKHDDEEDGDGIYTGTYTIKKGDNLKDGRLKVKAVSTNGKSVERYALEKVSIDTIPPLPINDLIAIDKPDDEGGFILLSWSPSNDEEFKKYLVYQSEEFITSVHNLTPLNIPLMDRNKTNIEIKVPISKLDIPATKYYFAVTAVDIATNESGLGRGSTTGPVSSIDNLPPLPVAKVSGYDRKFDHGKVIVITWSQSSIAEDFHNYNVYIGQIPIDIDKVNRVPQSFVLIDSSITDRNVRLANIVVPEDNKPFYFVVTAVDNTGNESEITIESMVGPIFSEDNLGQEPDTIVRIISGPVGEINHNDVTFQWSRWFSGTNTLGYYYKLDDGNWIWTNEITKTYRNLRDGQHTFYLRADLGSEGVDPMPAIRAFSIKRITISESEPNNSTVLANWIPREMTITGKNDDESDDDWFRFHVGSSRSILTLHFDKISGNSETQVKIFRSLPPTEESKLSDITLDPINNNASILLGLNVGDYFVLVNSAEEARYELSVAIYELPQIACWDIEGNNTPILAQLAGRWNIIEDDNYFIDITGLGNKSDDIDWYKVQFNGLPSDKTAFMKLDFIRPRVSESTEISVYASLPVNETPKVGFIDYMSGIFPIQTISIPIKSGDYYIKVENKQETDINNLYSIRVSTFVKQEKWELEPNNVSQSANMLNINQVIKGTSLDADNDPDWFKIRINERQTFVASIYRPSGKGTTEIKLKSSNLTDIASAFTNDLTGHKATVSANLNVGDYFIVIVPSSESDPLSEYELVTTSLKINYTKELIERPDQTQESPLSIGDKIKLSATWLAGNSITYDLGDIRTNLTMLDDGKHDDIKADDSIYAGSYVVQSGDDISDGKILLYLSMPPLKTQGSNTWIAEFVLQDQLKGTDILLNIDTTPPKIFSVTSNMPIKPLIKGNDLNVTMIGEANAKKAYFIIELASENQDKIIFRNSEFLMQENPDGTYKGSYKVIDGDNIDNGVITCYLIDDAGNKLSKAAQRPIFFDTTPPRIISIKHNAEKVLVDGDTLIVEAISDTKKGKATFDIGDLIEALPMTDDGIGYDKIANDGTYTGFYNIRKGDNAKDALISVSLEDEAGNKTESLSRNPISIDTTPPKIDSFVHNAKNILTEGNKLIVTMKGDPENFATFDIGGFITGIPMYDDGTRDDTKANDGIYVGSYIVKKNDFVKDARITGYLVNKNGNQSISVIFERINIDAVLPASVVQVSGIDRENDNGYWIILTWKAITDTDDFSHYNIYREATPITSVMGLTPIVDDGSMKLDIHSTNQVEVNVPTNGTNHYFAVTVVDSAGNESSLDISKVGSTFGPIRAIDNISPDPISVVSTYDRPNDQGRTIIVAWTNPNIDIDFAYYNIYLSSEPIKSIDNIDPLVKVTRKELIDITDKDLPPKTEVNIQRRVGVYVSVPNDDQQYYFAVTAVDNSENESKLDENGDSVAGPVISKDNLPPKPVIVYDVVDTPSDEGGYITAIWIINKDEEIQYYNIYISDELIDNVLLKTLKPIDSVTPKLAIPIKNTEFISHKIRVPNSFVYIAITAVDLGSNESLLDKDNNSVAGPVQAVSNIVMANTKIKITAGFDPDTSITIPVGTFNQKETVDIIFPDDAMFIKIDEADKLLERSHIDPSIDRNFAGTVRVFESSSAKLSKQVIITLTYPDINDMRNLPETLSQDDERQFRIFKLNESSRVPRWELVMGQQDIDTIQNIISVQVDKLGIFRIAKLKLPENLDRVVVYPNPFIPSQSINGYITFRNLTENITIHIYSLDGREVAVIEKIGGGDRATWNALNKNNEEVASGTYIYVVQNESQKSIGKIVIMR